MALAPWPVPTPDRDWSQLGPHQSSHDRLEVDILAHMAGAIKGDRARGGNFLARAE